MAVTRPAEADAAESVGRRWTSVQAMPGVTVLRVACEHIAGAVVLRCAGSVDASNADELRTAIESTVSAVVVVELGGLDRFDSEGVQALEQAFRGRRSNHRSFFVVAPPGCAAERTYRTAARGRQRLVATVDAALQQHG
jgi:anti-anti-sigma factor